MKAYRILFAATLILLPLLTQAQPPQAGEGQRLTPQVMARMFPAGVNSPEYNADGSVTFRFQAADAKEVKLDCQMLAQAVPMYKGENGVWSITVTPGKPNIYPYCFLVDGMQVADPNNMFIFPNEGFKNSLVDVRGPVPSVQDVRDVPHGKVSYRYYHSTTCNIDRVMCVYTPAGYEPNGSERLPVLYLIHGMTDTYETWFKVGHVNNILDNLIAEGKAKRMIVVMPYANPYPEMIRQGKAERYDSMGTDIVTNEIMKDVKPFIEANYKVKTSAADRAVAGFSLGGRQALACGLGNPKSFQYVCAMAPAIFGEEYKTNFSNGTYAPLADVKKNVKFLWLGTGTSDFLISASRGLDAYLTEQGVKHTFYTPDGGHTWMNCRDYLAQIAQKLFK